MKNSNGFILRGLPSQHILHLGDDLKALYKDNIRIIYDTDKIPDSETNEFICYIFPIEPFTLKKRQLYHISESETGISQTKSNEEK